MLFLLVFFTALGRRVSRFFHLSYQTFPEELSYSFGLGTGIVIFLLIGLASLGVLYQILIFLMILLIAGLIYSDIKYLCLRGYGKIMAWGETRHSLLESFFTVLLLLATCITFLGAATPPFFFDALTYHLGVPQQYLQNHGFHYIPHHYYSNFPANMGMLFLVGLSFSGGMLAHLISWIFAPMTAFAVYAFAKLRWGNSTAITAAVILLFVPGILIASILTSVDNAVMFYSFLSCSALLSWCASRQKSWFILSGIFCGLAVGSKYTALAVTFITLEFILFLHEYVIEKRGVLLVLRTLIVFGLIVLVLISPWLIKNSLYTGNPLFPFFNSVFGVQGTEAISYGQILSRRIPESTDWLKRLFSYYLAAPWTTSMQVDGAAGIAGVLFLLCLPLLFLLKKNNRLIRYLVLASVCSFGVWIVFLPRVLRYVFPAFPFFSLVLADTFWRMSKTRYKKAIIFGGLSLILLYQGGLFLRETSFQPMTYIFPPQSQEDFLIAQGVNSYPAIEYINTETPLDSKILFVGEMRGFYCRRDYEAQVVRSDEDIFLQQLILQTDSISKALDELRRKKFSHLLINMSEMQRIAGSFLDRESFFHFEDTRKGKMLEELLSERYLHPVFSKYNATVYEIVYPQ
jgi:hypothetical protein